VPSRRQSPVNVRDLRSSLVLIVPTNSAILVPHVTNIPTPVVTKHFHQSRFATFVKGFADWWNSRGPTIAADVQKLLHTEAAKNSSLLELTLTRRYADRENLHFAFCQVLAAVADSVTTTYSADEATSPPRLELHRASKVSLLILGTVLILFARRPDQFLHPALWVEETVILREYIDHGWWSLLEPLNGYYVLISKIIAFIAFRTSFSSAPQVELFLTVAFTCAVIASVALSPTHLQWPFLCALSVLLVPSDPEVFAVSVYAFWWAGTLLLLVLLWRSDARRQWLRWLYIVIGGLSSPIIVVVAGLLAIRSAFERRPSEYCAAGLGVLVALMQVITVHANVPFGTMKIGLSSFVLTIQRFYGLYFIPRPGLVSSCVGFAVVISLVFIAWSCRARLNGYFCLLLLAHVGICALVLFRIPVDGIHPLFAGARYFFYPFILLNWIMIWLTSVSDSTTRFGFALALLIALMVCAPHFARWHEPIDWQAAVSACGRSTQYDLPAHYDGQSSTMWHASLTGQECQKLESVAGEPWPPDAAHLPRAARERVVRGCGVHSKPDWRRITECHIPILTMRPLRLAKS
jgi:hypothetical protein